MGAGPFSGSKQPIPILNLITPMFSCAEKPRFDVKIPRIAMPEAHRLKAALEAVQILHKGETEAVSETRKQLDVLNRQIVACKSQEEAAQLESLSTKAGAASGERDAARATAGLRSYCAERLL